MIGTHPSVEGHVRARRAGPGRVARLLAAGSALSMLSLSVAVTGAGASSDITTVAQLQSALCTDGGATVALTGDIDESGSILTVAGGCTATLDLNGKNLTVLRIDLQSTAAFTIDDTSSGSEEGRVETAANNFEAGIRTVGATLTIAGGIVTAMGGSGGAGIGGGSIGSGSGGSVFISGGTVTATGQGSGAGIGGGTGGSGGSVFISGGTVTATGGGGGGAGIGGGAGGHAGVVEISGGTVNATSTSGAAGIGGGEDGASGSVLISAGVVVATSTGTGAGIGAAAGFTPNGGTIVVEGGSVNATGGGGAAGIGGASQGSGGEVEISGGSVTATGGPRGAGIGGGDRGSGGSVQITGGSVIATAGESNVLFPAAPIGAGEDGDSPGTVEVTGDFTDVEDTTDGGLPRRTIIFAAPPPPPAALSLETQPSGAVVGAPLGVQPVVGLVDAAGDPVVQSGVEVSVAVASGPGSLGGVTSVETGSDGLAVFSGLSIDAEGEHTLVFTADGLEPVTSGTVLVGGGAVSDHPGVTVQVDASPLLVSVADSVVAFTVTAGTELDGGPDGVDGAARRQTAVTFDNPVGSASGSARVEVEFAAVPEALSATSAGSVPDRELVLHLWVEPPATAAFDTAPVSWGAAADGAQVLVSGIGQGVGLQSGLTMWWGLSGQTGAGTGGVPVTVGTVTFTITDDDG